VPLVVVDLIAGRSAEQVRALLNGVHDAVVEGLAVPQRDRYQIVHEHDPSWMVVQDTGLGIERSRDVVIIQVTSRPRPREQKVALPDGVRAAGESVWHESARRDDHHRGNTDEDWSFGHGRAQFLTGEL
jgi:phenylpyruvate tautomerase PptA (4-oxalocrotonate tautomerase family)